MKKLILPPTYLLLALSLMIVLHLILPVMTILVLPWNLLGLLPLAAGIILNLQADRAFHLAGTTVKPFEESHALIVGGVFRLSRHPMYLGFVFILIGIGILLGSLSPWIIPPVFAIWLDIRFMVTEEKMLAARFGAAWQDYRRKVRRWL